jgi:CelD/BcsL family acetyltransferase involved in cellulose biosynthesis
MHMPLETWPREVDRTTCTVTPLDEAVQQHLSPRYWAWRRLYDADPQAAPLQHPDVVLADLAHQPRLRLTPALVLSEHRGGATALGALVPKRVSLHRLGGLALRVPVEGLRLAGNGFLALPGAPLDELLRIAFDHARRQGAGFVLIEDLDDATPLAAALAQALPAGWRTYHHAGVQPRRRIALPERRDDYWNTFSKKTLSTLRRKQKKFGETRLERITDVTQVARFLEVASAVSRQTWQSRQFGLRIRNDDAELAVLTTLAQHGLLRSYLWFSNDEPAAFLLGEQDKGRFHYDEVGYATPFARYSPGQVMLVQVLDDLFSHQRPEWFDFGGGDADYKAFFANHVSRSGTVWLFPPTAAGSAVHGWLCASRTVRQCARRLVIAGGWASRARQWVRYGRIRETSPDREVGIGAEG